MLCKYKNMFGEVGTGVHAHRVFNIAIVDVLATMFLALVIRLLIPKSNYLIILVILFILGIVMHRLFCVRTTVDKFLFRE